MAQQTAEHALILAKRSYHSDPHGPFSRQRREFVGQHCGARADGGGGARLMAHAHSHNHYEETIYGVDGALTIFGLLQGSGSRAELQK